MPGKSKRRNHEHMKQTRRESETKTRAKGDTTKQSGCRFRQQAQTQGATRGYGCSGARFKIARAFSW